MMGTAEENVAYEETPQTRAIWHLLVGVEEELWQTRAMMAAICAVFQSGQKIGGLDEEACIGGEQIVRDIQNRFDRVAGAWNAACEATGVKPQGA